MGRNFQVHQYPQVRIPKDNQFNIKHQLFSIQKLVLQTNGYAIGFFASSTKVQLVTEFTKGTISTLNPNNFLIFKKYIDGLYLSERQQTRNYNFHVGTLIYVKI